ncbi:hypothetical protein HPB48_017936 [Haemaphysalis longicornis]|uniref:Uncharacterized protein n=1 Tax=Haemaphysalis longicornis TaxID=44386 RepID=A0A9J6H5Z2_HAELO|nr:hypothetical protein HPB48_017936 [Haemaphysalis longicornis]
MSSAASSMVIRAPLRKPSFRSAWCFSLGASPFFGRRIIPMSSLGSSGSRSSFLQPSYFQATTTFFSLVGMSAIYVANAQLPLVTIEQYPSPLRAVSLSCALLAGQLGFLTAPFVSEQLCAALELVKNLTLLLRIFFFFFLRPGNDAGTGDGAYGPMFVASITSLTVGWLLVALPETKFENIAALKDK